MNKDFAIGIAVFVFIGIVLTILIIGIPKSSEDQWFNSGSNDMGVSQKAEIFSKRETTCTN